MSCCSKVKIGVFGGKRGSSMVSVLANYPDAELVAVCDSSASALENCKQLAKDHGSAVTFYQDFDKFFEHDMDAVVLANFATEHAPYAIKFLDSGRHVCSELMPSQTMAESVQLVEAVERNPKQVYAYAENVCYFPAVMEMQKLYKKGDIGEFLYAEGQYLHGCTSIWGELTQCRKDHWRNWTPSTFYVTHSTGPILSITGTRPVRVSAYETPNVLKRLGGGLSSDAAVVVCQMDNGAVATIIPWANLRREPAMQWFSLYGSKGMMETDRWGDTSAALNIYREGEEFKHYNPEFRGGLSASDVNAGHGGADYFTLHYFVQAILDRPGKEYVIDVYQALDMTLPGMLGYRSIWEGNIPIDLPDFRDKGIREKYRNDNWSVDPKLAGPGQPTSCSTENVDIPDSFYSKLREENK